MGSNQSGVIFGFVAVAFVVYITLKGELPIYAGLLLLAPAGSAPGNTNASNTTSSAVTSTIINGAITGLL